MWATEMPLSVLSEGACLSAGLCTRRIKHGHGEEILPFLVSLQKFIYTLQLHRPALEYASLELLGQF